MFVSNRKIRVLIAGVGIEQDKLRRTKELARILCDAGMDIIRAEQSETPENIAAAAIREDVDVVGLSVNGVHNSVCQRVIALLRANRMDDCLVVACNTVPNDEAKILERQGVSKAFPLGAPPSAVIDYLQTHVRPPWSIPDNPQILEVGIV